MESAEDYCLAKEKGHGLDNYNILSSAYDSLTCLTETSCYILSQPHGLLFNLVY